MTQAKGTVKMDNVFKAVVIVMLLVISGFGYSISIKDNKIIDLSSIEDRLDNIEANQANTEVATVEVDTSAIEAKIDSINNILDDLMDNAYSDEKEDLESDGLAAFEDEFDMDDFEDALEELIVGFDVLKNDEYDDDFGENGTKFFIINLGLEDDEDKEIEVQKLIKIKYELDDSDDRFKAEVLVTGKYYYDDEDEEFKVDFTYELA